jgi:hypothetical protein
MRKLALLYACILLAAETCHSALLPEGPSIGSLTLFLHQYN